MTSRDRSVVHHRRAARVVHNPGTLDRAPTTGTRTFAHVLKHSTHLRCSVAVSAALPAAARASEAVRDMVAFSMYVPGAHRVRTLSQHVRPRPRRSRGAPG